MAKKKKEETPEEQFERFRKTVQDMVDAGEQNPAEAEEAMERVMKQVVNKSPSTTSS